MQHLQDQGFVTFLETVRRDHGPSWKRYFDWPGSYIRYVQYIIARYGAYNIIFSGIHLDGIPEHYSLSADEFNEALSQHFKIYSGLPYGQPYTTLICASTYKRFGHKGDAPWLTMHSVGNDPRHHQVYPMIEEVFHLSPAYPAANLEAYYPGWNNRWKSIAGERPEDNSDRDHYFARAQMYGSVLSGGLAGHMYGSGGFSGNTTGEPKNSWDNLYIWEALMYPSGAQLPFLAKFILSEGSSYQDCIPVKQQLDPFKSEGSLEDGLDGWAFLMMTPGQDLGFAYFENACEIPLITGLLPEREYQITWFDPISGEWLEDVMVQKTSGNGTFTIAGFPGGETISTRDWSMKITVADSASSQ